MRSRYRSIPWSSMLHSAMEACSSSSLGNFLALSATAFRILSKLSSCPMATAHSACKSGSVNGVSCPLGGLLLPSSGGTFVVLIVASGGSKSCRYRCCKRSSCWPSGMSCSLRERASGHEARVPGRYESLKQYRASISAHRICRSFNCLAFIKCSRFLWSVRIVKDFTLHSSASHSSKQWMTASNSLS
jgi:hypothetical protein